MESAVVGMMCSDATLGQDCGTEHLHSVCMYVVQCRRQMRGHSGTPRLAHSAVAGNQQLSTEMTGGINSKTDKLRNVAAVFQNIATSAPSAVKSYRHPVTRARTH